MIDILNLEWPGSERDRHIITPVYLYLRKKYNLKVVSKNIFYGYFFILLYKPRLVLISNGVGDIINVNILKFCRRFNIKTVTLISEGIIADGYSDYGFLWGWNNEKRLIQDLLILWNNLTKEKLLELAPAKDHTNIKVSGNPGFDRYKLLNFLSKEDFLKKHKLNQFKKVIGIAGWGFDRIFDGPYFEKNKTEYLNTWGWYSINTYREDFFLLKEIYKNLIESHPDVLFILKSHPGIFDNSKNEFNELTRFRNVFLVDKEINTKLSVSELINISDIWIAYESTTCLEAWLLNKTTFYINPTNVDFVRLDIYKGHPVYKNFEKCNAAISEFYETGTIQEFEQLKTTREKIIITHIGGNDGKNHIRAAKLIFEHYRKFKTTHLKKSLLFYKTAIKETFTRFWNELKQYKHRLIKTFISRNIEILKFERLYNKVIK